MNEGKLGSQCQIVRTCRQTMLVVNAFAGKLLQAMEANLFNVAQTSLDNIASHSDETMHAKCWSEVLFQTPQQTEYQAY